MTNPSKDPMEPIGAPAQDGRARFGSPYRILVVDDDHDTLITMHRLLEVMGGTVRSAQDGLSALEIAAEFRPQIVLLDISMPELDGYETARLMRQASSAPGLILVALTGWGREYDRRRSVDAGFDDHLTKPTTILLLRQTVERLVQKKSLLDSLIDVQPSPSPNTSPSIGGTTDSLA
jgi:two-component system, chemotaxis family, CheB/CheR fusion protein